jgi:hypothetical protein
MFLDVASLLSMLIWHPFLNSQSLRYKTGYVDRALANDSTQRPSLISWIRLQKRVFDLILKQSLV